MMPTNPEKVLQIYHNLEQEFAALIPKTPFSKNNNMRLERITHLLELLGNPQDQFSAIHIGGTSGKGSTATLTAAILTAQGYRTGLHLSPHLQIFNERYQINHQPIATTTIATQFEQLKPALAQVERENFWGMPSYFETQVALAFCLFAAHEVEVAVVEVGLGGSLDATNVLASEIAVLTAVGLDHTEILGDTIEQIAQDKVGIIKNQQIVVCGFSQASTQAIVAQRCQQTDSKLWQLGRDFSYAHSGTELTLFLADRTYSNLPLPGLGQFQQANTACAVAAAFLFCEGKKTSSMSNLNSSQQFISQQSISRQSISRQSISQQSISQQSVSQQSLSLDAVHQGLNRAKLPGRMEIVQREPIVVLDGAHNPDKMAAAAETLRLTFPEQNKILVISIKVGKAAVDMMPLLLPQVQQVVVTSFRLQGLWKPYPPEELADLIQKTAPGLPLWIRPDPLEALELALAIAKPADLVWVTGSLYLVGNIRGYWYPAPALILAAESKILAAELGQENREAKIRRFA